MTDVIYQELPLILSKTGAFSSLDGAKDAVTFGLSRVVGAAAKGAE